MVRPPSRRSSIRPARPRSGRRRRRSWAAAQITVGGDGLGGGEVSPLRLRPETTPARRRRPGPAGQEAADGVEGAQRVLQVGRVLRLRPGGELHADRVRTPADVHHLAMDAQAEQHVAVVTRAEPELVPVPPAGKGPLGGRRGERGPRAGVDGPGLAQPVGRHDPAGVPGPVRNQPAVQQHLAEPAHVAGGGAQAPVVHGGAQAVVQQLGVCFGAHRRPDQLGHQLSHGPAGRALADPAQHVRLRGAVQEPRAVRRLGLQRGQEPVKPAGLPLAGLPPDPLVEPPDVGVRAGVLLDEPDPAAHVEDVPDQGAGVAAAGQFGHVAGDLAVRVQLAAVDEHGGHAAHHGLRHRHQRVRPVRGAQRAVPLGH